MSYTPKTTRRRELVPLLRRELSAISPTRPFTARDLRMWIAGERWTVDQVRDALRALAKDGLIRKVRKGIAGRNYTGEDVGSVFVRSRQSETATKRVQ